MRNKCIFLIGLFLLQFSVVKSQCYKLVSPKPLCTSVLKNGDVQVHLSIGSMGAGVKPEYVDRIELEYSQDGQFFNAVSSLQIGKKWPGPIKILHTGVNAQSQTGIYRTVAYCDTATNYALPTSDIVKSIKLDYVVNSDNHVKLNWNWDTVAENMLIIVKRKSFMANKWDSVGSPVFKQGQISFIDSSLLETDTLTYRVDYLNLDKLCQGFSSEVTFIYVWKQKPTGIEEIDIEELKIWPNPTHGNLSISYQLIREQKLSIDVFNSLGQQIKSIKQDGSQAAGSHLLEINLPAGIKPGIYLVRFSSGSYVKTIMFEYLD